MVILVIHERNNDLSKLCFFFWKITGLHYIFTLNLIDITVMYEIFRCIFSKNTNQRFLKIDWGSCRRTIQFDVTHLSIINLCLLNTLSATFSKLWNFGGQLENMKIFFIVFQLIAYHWYSLIKISLKLIFTL